MNTYLSDKKITQDNITIQQVLNIDEAIGKTIKTKEDFIVVGDSNESGFEKINIKEKIVKIEDVIRTSGLYLYCRTTENFTFALSPDELEKFEEVL